MLHLKCLSRMAMRLCSSTVSISPNAKAGLRQLGSQAEASTSTPQKPGKRANKRHRPLSARTITTQDSPEAPSATFMTHGRALAHGFDLDGILADRRISVVDNAVHLNSRHKLNEEEVNELFIFSDGVLVFWNVEHSQVVEQQNQLCDLLDAYKTEPVSPQLVVEEAEDVAFQIVKKGKSALRNDVIQLATHSDDVEAGEEDASIKPILERFAFSHALAVSVKIGIWEAELNEQAEPLAALAKALTDGKVLWRRKDTLKKVGEFAELRHSMNLSDLLCEDFYWDRPDLERIYVALCKYFTISKRLNKMDKRLEYCEELVKVIDQTLQHRHSSFLEWLIIWLIVIEVFFDVWHFLDRIESKAAEK